MQAALSDRLVGIISPRAMRRRMAARAGAELVDMSLKAARPSGGRRRYEAGRHNRLTRDWHPGPGSADATITQDLGVMRNRSRDLARNNPYVAALVRQLVANLVGDGIEARAAHPDPAIQKLAQEIWLKFARSKVDGRHDFYGLQKLAVRTMVEGGDVLNVWTAKDGVPDARCRLVEGDQLETPSGLWGLLNTNGPVIRDGVEFDGAGDRAAYHLLRDHPGDMLRGLLRKYDRVDAQHVDHMFEPTRPGQTRGVPWLAPSMMIVRMLQDLDVAIATKKRMQACIGIIRTMSRDEDEEEVDVGTETEAGEDEGSGSPALERMVPGMVVEGLPGEQYTTITPTADGDSDTFYRQQLRSVAAAIGIPDHLMTGDVGQANYSSLRAATVAFWAVLDDWQWNVIVPFLCDPAFARVMRREALLRREPRLAECTAEWTPPPRQWVDPIKDVAALVMQERAGFINKPEILAQRGKEYRAHFEEKAAVQALGDKLGLVFDTDPRRVNGSGALQPPSGFVLPKDDADSRSVVSFFGRMLDATERGDRAAINQGFVEAATALRDGDPNGQAMAAIIGALTGADEPENRE